MTHNWIYYYIQQWVNWLVFKYVISILLFMNMTQFMEMQLSNDPWNANSQIQLQSYLFSIVEIKLRAYLYHLTSHRKKRVNIIFHSSYRPKFGFHVLAFSVHFILPWQRRHKKKINTSNIYTYLSFEWCVYTKMALLMSSDIRLLSAKDTWQQYYPCVRPTRYFENMERLIVIIIIVISPPCYAGTDGRYKTKFFESNDIYIKIFGFRFGRRKKYIKTLVNRLLFESFQLFMFKYFPFP